MIIENLNKRKSKLTTIADICEHEKDLFHEDMILSALPDLSK